MERSVPGLDRAHAERAIGLADGPAVVLGAICAAGGELGPRAGERALARTGSPDELLGALARTWLTSMQAGARRTLALALELGYSHPALLAVIGAEPLPSGPWGQQLEGGWTRIRTPWRSALGRIGAMRPFLNDAVHGAAEFLVKTGAIEQAVRLYLGLGDIESGALTIDREADRLVDLGQWETVNAWLEQLPEGVRTRHPRFLHRRAEIAAGEGRTSAAERDFAQAATLCTAQRDIAGACQSMLAESALAARRGDLAHARDRALAASRVTGGAGLRWQQLWADWQLGVLAALTGSLDDALPHFGRAIAVIEEIGEPPMLGMLRSAEGRTRRLHRVRAQREQHRQAYLALAATEQETAADLLVELDAGGRRRDPLAARYGWSHVPMLLKVPAGFAAAASDRRHRAIGPGGCARRPLPS